MGTSPVINELFLTELLLLLLSSGQVLAASFYGDGYVLLKTSEVSSKTSLHVRFRTSCPSGVLFLSAGETDFLLLELHSGHLQVSLDLGSGERSLRSDAAVLLNDLAWHSAKLHHDRHNVTLTVDRRSHTALTLPGPDVELSVQDGLYVGGVGPALDRPYLRRHPSSEERRFAGGFRGCVDEVLFNQHNLLSSLRPYSGYKSVHEVSLGCGAQFSASEDDAVSFFSSRAFLALPPWGDATPAAAQEGGVFECEMRVGAVGDAGLVLYSAAGGDGGFVALEVREGRVAAAVATSGGRRSELRTVTRVDDRAWHAVRLRLLPDAVRLRVGGEEVNASLAPPPPWDLRLGGPLYLGGVGERAHRAEAARGAGPASGDRRRLGGGGSFKGCLRDVRVNGRRTGLPHATVTKDVAVGCEPEDVPEAAATTAGPSASDQLASATPPSDRRRNHPSFLLLTDLVVAEGGRAPLEARNIKVNINFRKLGLRQSQVQFRVEEQPFHGQLRLDPGPGPVLREEEEEVEKEEVEEEEWVFGMMDLWHGRVMYVHGGAENPEDFFMFSVFTSSKKQLPPYLKGNKLHRFTISVMPVNDAPELSLPEGHLFTVLENSSRPLTTDVLWASDPDTNSTQLQFAVMGELNTEAGHLEHSDLPGTPITSFSLPDLEEGKVSYRHMGVKTSRLALRVSDGEKVSNTVVLRILAVQMDHRVVNNTGLEVDQGGPAVLNSTRLAVRVTVDAGPEPVEVRFDVIEGPRYGELQRLHSGGEWKYVSYFYQAQMEKERVRYLNTFHGLQTGNVTDQFRCKVTIGSMATDEVVVPVKVSWIHYKVTRTKMDVGASTRTTVVTPDDLHAISKGVKLPESELFFRLLTLPRKGQLLLDHRVLRKNSTFSQRNVSDGMVKYELSRKPDENTRDAFGFQVFSRHARSESHDFRINIRADGQSLGLVLVNQGLVVLEGEGKIISKDRLFIQTSRTVHYIITRAPAHGRVARINLSNSPSANDNVMTFTNQDVAEERVMYVHDDSETTADSFAFRATAAKSAKQLAKKEEVGAIGGIFNISVQLVNDQKPVRVVDKVFHVVRDGQRLLTLADLRYHDADSDFDDGRLVYTRRGIPLGELVLANDTSRRLYQFSQADLAERRVLFLHRGVSSGRFVLFVTDGKHYVSSLLEVLAQDPYISVENNTGVRVQRGHAATLWPANLGAVTNVDVRDEREVTYDVFLPPRRGGLFLDGVRAERFTQGDLRAGRLAYRHDDGQVLADGFNVTACVGEVCEDAAVRVRVYLESHQTPPVVRRHSLVVVEEGRPVRIYAEQLEVVHADSLPSEILFTVKMAPAHGFLRRSANEGESEASNQGTEAEPLQTFSQEDINHGLLQYVQTSPARTNDSFLLDATNGVTGVSDVRVVVDIIPLLVPLEVANLTLDEGSSETLTSDIIKVANRHFAGINFVYHVTEPPRRGHIEHTRLPGVPVPSFTRKQVEQEYIRYVHDGSDTVSDSFTLLVNDTDIRKHSLPCSLLVNVSPVNDQPPFMTANRILRVWAGSVTQIMAEDLCAEDSDSEADSLEFVVTPPSNGHLALKSAPSRHILNFTQAHIFRGQLVFVHIGASSGGFHFQVNDGVNFAPREIFSTAARSLVLTLEKNQELQVYPGSVVAISQKDLLVVTNDNGEMRGNHSVVFSVTSPPKLGRLIRRTSENSSLEATTFTQSMVNKGLISYHQTHPESVGWTASDSFTFSVSAPPAFLHPSIFYFHISYDHADPQRHTLLLANTGAVVAEGSRVLIDRINLDASNLLGKLPEARRSSHQIWYHLTSLPRHGVIAIGDHNLTGVQAGFSQLSLDQSRINYVHDDSETNWDSFSFEVWVCPAGLMPPQRPQEEGWVVAESFNVTVTSVNDHPPLLRSSAPGLRVAQGEAVVLGPDYLQVDDHDTPPEDIHYRVISKPSSGHLSLGTQPRLSPPVASFSQADVNRGRLHFIQQGESSAPGVFYFSITDGHHRPLYKLFNLEVTPAAVRLVNNTGLDILQGHTSVVVTSDHLAAQTDPPTAAAATITYTVTSLPRHGHLVMNDQKVDAFDQEDVRRGRLVYLMMDLTASSDSFVVAVAAGRNLTLANQEVRVTVRPLIYLREPVLVPSGIAVKLRKDTLDATELAALSGGDPRFRVLRPPRHGELVKLPFGLDESQESHAPVTEFTFADVEQGRIAIKETIGNDTLERRHRGNKTAAGVMALNDSFVFLLSAERVQPAVGELLFTIVPYHHIPPGAGVEGGGRGGGAKGRNEHTPRPPGRNRTTGGGGGAKSGNAGTRPLRPHAATQKNNRTKLRQRWGNHTRKAPSPSPSPSPSLPSSSLPSPSSSLPPKPSTPPPNRTPSPVESHLPWPASDRPASDPLLIILPFLACLLLIVILVVVILVFRHRREKRARSHALIRGLAAPASARDSSPYLGRPERSQAVPSVVVTPLHPSCPGSPLLPHPQLYRRRSLTPGLPVWAPLGSETPPGPRRSPTPTLRDSQYWV